MYNVTPNLMPSPFMVLCGYFRKDIIQCYSSGAIAVTPEKQKGPLVPSPGLHP